MDYYKITIRIKKMLISGEDKYGNIINGELTKDDCKLSWYPNQLYTNLLWTLPLSKIMAEEEINDFIEIGKNYFYEQQNEYIKNNPKYFNKYNFYTAPFKGIRKFIDYKFVFKITSENLRTYSLKTCAELLTAEQLIDFYGDTLKEKLI